jgi:NAD(P)-dependent dehydrogenase (short-subunit alcohol dehydrogenase family)
MKSFHGKVAAITGAGSGIGRALAQALAAQGCHLALSDINQAGLAETAGLLAGAAVKVTTTTLDVADREAVRHWASQAAADHGRVNLIFNNAGVSLAATIEGASDADLEWIVGINFWGVMHGTRAFLPHLRASGDGHVVNISSLFGLLAMAGSGAYNATKFAVRGMTEALRQELDLSGAPVSATSVHPGGIRTNISRGGRISASVKDIGMDADPDSRKFERYLVTPPERAAEVILKAVRRNQRRVLIGRDARFFDLAVRLFPSGYQRLTELITRRTLN